MLSLKFHIKPFAIFLFTMICTVQASAAITAQFSTSDSLGCAPLVTNFEDISSGGNIIYWFWDFGNGNTATGNPNVGATYTTSGMYTVSLTVSDGIDTATITKTQHIEVHQSPVAAFYTPPAHGCAPFQWYAQDSSYSIGSPIISWNWDFDDGSGFHSGQNQLHTFTQPGIYDVTLVVTNAAGCINQKVIQQAIEVTPKPVAGFFSLDPLSACQAPLTVNFTNTSTGISNNLNYLWTIGGFSYNTYNTSHTFTNVGNFDASLVVTDSLGCTDTLVQPNYVNIGPLSSTITALTHGCKGQGILFEGQCLGANSFTWDFDDGTGLHSGATNTHVFTVADTYNVVLTANLNGLCTSSDTHQIIIEEVIANFSSTPNFACEPPLQVQFTNQSIGNIISWEWRFGYPNNIPCLFCPSQTDTTQNPSFTYYTPGVYNDTLIVASALGCRDTLVKIANEEIFVIETDFETDVTSGCGPLLVDFTNLSTPHDSIDSVYWDYGDGSAIDTTFSPVHLFTTSGTYTVTLQVVSVSGCTTDVSTTIMVGDLQNADFTIDTLITCASDTVSFTNLSTDSNLIDEYIWSFSDGQSQNVPHPEVRFIDTGYVNATLIVGNNGCYDTLSLDSAVMVLGPYLEATTSFECDSLNLIEFEVTMKGGTEIYYNFGDSSGIDSSQQLIFAHAYPPIDSTYIFIANAYDSNTQCSFELETEVEVEYYEGVISISDTTPCKNQLVNFSLMGSTNVVANPFWALNVPNTFNQKAFSWQQSIVNVGWNTVYAAIEADNGCLDTISAHFYAYEPVADFNIDTTFGCAPFTAIFHDSSTSDTNIVSWLWEFGDMTSSTTQHPSHVYTAGGFQTYDVKLTVVDTFGCAAEKEMTNYVYTQKPGAMFGIVNGYCCEGDTVSFHNVPTGNFQYQWAYSDSVYDSVAVPSRVFDSMGVYTPTLMLIDAQGCADTFSMVNGIQVQSYPVADFIADPLVTECYPRQVTFTDSSTTDFPLSWVWNFGDSPNDIATTNNVVKNVYNYPGFYDVTMIALTSHGCADTVTKPQLIHIGGPTASIAHDPLIGCVGEPIQFAVDSTNTDAQFFIWDFSNGLLDSNFVVGDTIVRSYYQTGYQTVYLTFSDSLKKCTKIDTAEVFIHEVIADVQLSAMEQCTPAVFGMLEFSQGHTSQYWYLNQTLWSNQSTYSDTISAVGDHELMFIAMNDTTLCADTVVQQLTVHPLPELTLTPDTVVCIGDSILLHVSGAMTYQWTPTTYVLENLNRELLALPNGPITYYVTGTDSNGCQNEDSVFLDIQLEPELLYMDSSVTIFLGEEFHINTLADMPMQYQWTNAFGLDCYTCAEPIASPEVSTRYVLTYADLNGCFVMDTTITITVLDEAAIYVPTAFTPNWDGMNDTFKPKIFGIKEVISFQIYDRWGKLVFETTQLDHGWNGRINGKMAAHNSMFSYVIQVVRFNDEIIKKVGSFVLISR